MHTLTVNGVAVAEYVDGHDIERQLSPRPFLHPVRTLGGTVVTDMMPEDHRWHLGVSVAIQDVAGANFWGGRTYVRDQGYVWRNDHGRQRHGGWLERTAHSCREELGWLTADERRLLAETRSLEATAHPQGGWVLRIAFELRNVSDEDLALGSPATNGRAGAGYGGLFWRLPRGRTAPRVFTARESGEAAVHGSTAPWLAWAGDDFTVVLAPADDQCRDPWFVRVQGYPGMCSALAFHQPLRLGRDEAVSRSYRALVVDGTLDRAMVESRLL